MRYRKKIIMKKLIFSLLLLGFCSVGFSQFDFGPRVGLGTSFTDISTTSDEISSGDAGFGFNVGVFARIGSKKLRFMPEVLYSTSTTNIIFNEEGTGQEIVESELDRVDIPLTLQYKPASFLNLGGGLIGSYLVGDVDGVVNSSQEAISNYRDFTLGYQGSVGVELGNFLIDLRYETSGSDISNNIGPFDFDERQTMIKGMLGIKIF